MPGKQRLLVIECVGLFFLLPVCLYFIRHLLAFFVFPLVMLAGLLCLAYLLSDAGFERKTLWKAQDLPAHFKSILLFFSVPAVCMAAVAWLFLESHFLSLPRSKPTVWLLVLILYPMLAVYPQELVFRAFFFHRYRSLFPNRSAVVIANGVSFGLAHLFYGNWVAPTLGALGGILFAYRYVNTRSLLVVSLEHALWGNFLYTVGIGWYFYSGSIH